MDKNEEEIFPDVTGQLARYIAQGGQAELPPEVIEKAKHHILDSLAAIIFGSFLKAGRLAVKFIQSQGGIEEAQVAGTALKTSAINAALANGLMGHAAEVDDYQSTSLTHAGIAVVPAALAVAEREQVDGRRFLKGVVVGYDICCRLPHAIGLNNMERFGLASHSVSGTFGAAAASASIMELDEQAVRTVLSYAVQQASGSLNWLRDRDHVEKAFVYGGMPARNGATAAIFAQLGFTGVGDPFVGRPNYLYFFSRDVSKPRVLIEGLGSRYEIMDNVLKKYAVGGPIQAPLDGLLLLMEKHRLTSKNVTAISVYLSTESLMVINDREMPNVNLQYILAATLLDGKITNKTTMSYERMNDPEIQDLKKRVKLVHEPKFDDPRLKRQAIVEVSTANGERWSEQVKNVRGTPENPMTWPEVEAKCLDLIGSVVGTKQSQQLVEQVRHLEQIGNMKEIKLGVG
jgi:2-methylcitrate dehydratase PrpD